MEQRAYLARREHHGQGFALPPTARYLHAEHLPVEKQDRRLRLILRGR
jgi:hypothetical protein